MLRTVFGPEMDEVSREHNEELNDLYSSSNVIRVIIREELNGRGL